MADGFSAEVVVRRKVQDGWQVYTCDQIPGLFVASEDDKAAYNDLPASIRALLILDFGIECVVSHKLSYAEFVQNMRLGDRAQATLAERTAELMGEAADMISFTLQHVAEGQHVAQ